MQKFLVLFRLIETFLEKIVGRGFDAIDVIRHLSENLELALKATDFKPSQNSEKEQHSFETQVNIPVIIESIDPVIPELVDVVNTSIQKSPFEEFRYKEGDVVNGNEKVIYPDNICGAIFYRISHNVCYVSTTGLKLETKDNKKALNYFASIDHVNQRVLQEWPMAKVLPDRIYFMRRFEKISCSELEILNTRFKSAELNILAALNTEFPTLYKIMRHGIQRKYSDVSFCCATFAEGDDDTKVNVGINASDWDTSWWHPFVL